jgi:hypothetical protein
MEWFVCGNAWRTIPASMCNANSELWRRWHNSVGMLFIEWTWPSCDTTWKSKCRMRQGHFDPFHTVYGRRQVQWWQVSVSAWQCFLLLKQGLWGNCLCTIKFQKWTGQPRVLTHRTPVGSIRTPTSLQTPMPQITNCSGYGSVGRTGCHSTADIQTPGIMSTTGKCVRGKVGLQFRAGVRILSIR